MPRSASKALTQNSPCARRHSSTNRSVCAITFSKAHAFSADACSATRSGGGKLTTSATEGTGMDSFMIFIMLTDILFVNKVKHPLCENLVP